MVSIVPADKETYSSLLKNIDLEPSSVCLVAQNREEYLGHIVYNIKDDTAILIDMKADDFTLGDGLVRAALNAAQQQGAQIAVCCANEMFPVLNNLHFIHKFENEKEKMYVVISKVFDGACSGCTGSCDGDPDSCNKK